MKKVLSLLLIAVLIVLCCTGCGKEKTETEETPELPSTGGLNQALESTGDSADNGPSYVINDDELDAEEMPSSADAPAAEMPTAEDENANIESSEALPEITEAPAESSVIVSQSEIIPFATEAPQPNAVITSFSACENTGLGFRFNYPTGWNNLPGRSTVCYVQPMTNGTVYPGRVSVTMKRLLHSCGMEDLQNELKSYHANLKTQFSKLKVPDNFIDTETDFMGKKALSFNYVAYDGSREIKGYVIMTHFERYVLVFHFLCAYGDYDNFYPSMIKMRDSVQVEQEK